MINTKQEINPRAEYAAREIILMLRNGTEQECYFAGDNGPVHVRVHPTNKSVALEVWPGIKPLYVDHKYPRHMYFKPAQVAPRRMMTVMRNMLQRFAEADQANQEIQGKNELMGSIKKFRDQIDVRTYTTEIHEKTGRPLIYADMTPEDVEFWQGKLAQYARKLEEEHK